MKIFTVKSKDLYNKRKNPKLSLSPTNILQNEKIKKTILLDYQAMKKSKKKLNLLQERLG